MEDLDVFKRHVGYRAEATQETFTGTELTTSVNLRYESVFDVVVHVGESLRQSSTYTVDSEAGVVTFTSAPEGEIVTVQYKYAPFTDAEAQALIDTYGVDKAVIEALREMLANTARLRNYKQADTEVDNSQVFKQLQALLKMYTDDYQRDQSSESGGMVIRTRNDPRGEAYCREQDISRLYG